MDDTLPWTFLDFSQFVSFPHAKRDVSVIIETILPAIRNPMLSCNVPYFPCAIRSRVRCCEGRWVFSYFSPKTILLF